MRGTHLHRRSLGEKKKTYSPNVGAFINKMVFVKQMGAAVQHIKQQDRFKTLLTGARRLKSESENSLIEKTHKKEVEQVGHKGQGIKAKLPLSPENKNGVRSVHVGSEDPVRGLYASNTNRKQKSPGNNVLFMAGQRNAATSHALCSYAPPAVQD